MPNTAERFLSSQRLLILITLMIGTFMAALDGSIVNISLPSMAEQFEANLTQIEWVVLAYMIAFAISIPLTGWLRDNVGFRWLYIGSLGVFIFGSALCAVSGSLNFLVFARVIQALGGGALTPAAMAILSTVFPPKERGRAIGIWGLGVVIGPAIGPTLGGILTNQFGWPSIFWVNVPVGIIGILLAYRVLTGPKLVERSKTYFDVVGFMSLSIFLISLLLAVGSFADASTNSILLLWGLVAGSFMIYFFSSVQQKNPLLDLGIFRNKQFVSCILVTVARSGALYGAMFLLPFLMQTLLKFSEVKSGLLMLPGSLLVAILMPWSGKWADSRGPKTIVIVGIILLSVSMLVFGFVSLDGAVLMILAAMVLRGVGLGLLAAPVSAATVNSVPEKQITLASSLSSLLQQCGGAFGVSIFALVHRNAFESAIKSGTGNAEAYALKFSFFTMSAAFTLAIIPALFLPKKGKTTAENVEMLVE